MAITYELAKRFREVIFSGTFVANTNYKHQLTDLDWVTATTQYDSLNTIALLAQHIHYYINGVKKVFEGGNLEIKDEYSFDFPPIQSHNDWDEFLIRFWNDAEKFALLIEELPEEKLTTTFVDEKYGSYQRNIDSMIEHCYYHLGQVVLIKKLFLSSSQTLFV